MNLEEELFTYIYKLQGVKHPVVNYDGLMEARSYIISELAACDIETVSEPFYLNGFDKPFYNIEAIVGTNPGLPVLFFGSHYDTTSCSPGANDNASGVAAMLHLAKHFKRIEHRVNIRFLFFTLEEGDPVQAQMSYTKGMELGVRDKHYGFTKLQYQIDSQLFTKALSAQKSASSYGEKYLAALAEIRCQLSPAMQEYYSALCERAKDYDDPLGFGQRALIGSSHWVQENLHKFKEVIGIIDLDSVAFASNKPYSHPMDGDYQQFDSSGLDFDRQTGNFIVLVSNEDTSALATNIKGSARQRELPYLYVSCPLDYATVAAQRPELLFADHAEFWKREVPCIFVTDTGGEVRYAFEHTAADTIDKLDFGFLGNVVETLRSAVEVLFESEVKHEQ